MIAWDEAPTITKLLARLSGLLKPRERLKCSVWAEKKRRLSPEASAQGGGKFSFNNAPWQREVCDAPNTPGVRGVVLQWASQLTGKTETLNNMIGHSIDNDPCPMLMVQPSVKPMAEAWSKDRLAPMLRDTPCLKGKVKDKRQRDSDNTVVHKRFPGGAISVGGANSPSHLASRPIRKCFFDEVDRFPPSSGKEGDPIFIARKRMGTYKDSVYVMTSTPTIKDLSRIEAEFKKSDQRYWFCACPRCGHEQHLKWGQVEWLTQGDEVISVWYKCENGECQAALDDVERQEMIRKGKWKATAPFKGIRGYHLNGIYCLFPAHGSYRDRLHQSVVEFLEHNALGPEGVKVWVNTYFAETYEEPTERPPAAKVLFDRREEYDPSVELPEGVCVIVAAADIQADRIEAEAEGVGIGEEKWKLERVTFAGDPEQPFVWEKFDEWAEKTWKHPCGLQLKIVRLLIDRGHKGKAVDDWTRKRNFRGFYSCQGANTEDAPLASRPMRSNYKRTVYFRVGTDVAKGMLMARLNIQRHGPRCIHFPKITCYDLEYFEQLTGEILVTEFEDGKVTRTWKKRRMRNEGLDLSVYELAALEILRPNLELISKNLALKAKSDTTNKDQATPGPKHDVPKKVAEDDARDQKASEATQETKAPFVRQRPVGGIRPGRGSFVGRWK